MSNISNQGIITSPNFIENEDIYYQEIFNNTFNGDLLTEPDGSRWVQIAYHSMPRNYLFSSSDSFTTKVNKSNLYFYVSLCNKISNGKYEFLIKQLQSPTYPYQPEKYRWIQYVNPMTATYADVDKTKIQLITNQSINHNYNTTTYGGLYHNGSYTYLSANNGTQGNWWGAIGSWTNIQNGIPGWNGTVILTGYIKLYLRIDDCYDLQNICSVANNKIFSKEIIEI